MSLPISICCLCLEECQLPLLLPRTAITRMSFILLIENCYQIVFCRKGCDATAYSPYKAELFSFGELCTSITMKMTAMFFFLGAFTSYCVYVKYFHFVPRIEEVRYCIVLWGKSYPPLVPYPALSYCQGMQHRILHLVQFLCTLSSLPAVFSVSYTSITNTCMVFHPPHIGYVCT